MHKDVEDTVLTSTNAKAIRSATVIQSLWSGYGEIVRLELEGAQYPSVILKHIKLPAQNSHPRGWNTDRSHARKIRSYAVEASWYQDYAPHCDETCSVPHCIAVNASESETVLVLSDLNAAGFDQRKETVDSEDIHACLDWLAGFHATFLDSPSAGLWECGSYWHLDTRPDELAALEDVRLREAAPLIDQHLRQCGHQTLIHGDAKLANFCFTGGTARPRVAAVDFQYVGRGCGMKDVAYFLGSCLNERDCEALASSLLDDYFSALRGYVAQKQPGTDLDDLESEWRGCFDVAWADFHRFMKGWSPGHWKVNSFSERLTQRVIESLLP